LGIVSCQEIPSNSAIYTVTDVDNNLILTINNHQELKVQLCGVLTQITATLRHPSTPLRASRLWASRSGWSGQYSLLDYSYKLSGFSPQLLIINSSPLIMLFKNQQAKLLPQLSIEILVPEG
jgi:hypothetical protein